MFRTFKKILFILLFAALIACAIFWATASKDMRQLVLNIPTDRDALFWSMPQRDAVFRMMDRVPLIIKSNIIAADKDFLRLALGESIDLGIDVDAFMKDQRGSALIIIHEGKIRLEKYGLDFNDTGRWTSFSMAKSLTSVLVGAAIKDGYIENVQEKVTKYIPGLTGSVYDEVTIEHLLTMKTGVMWNEDYSDPTSEVALFLDHKPEPGVDTTVSFMRQLKRESPPGEKWRYNTGETNLVGLLVRTVTGKPLAEYLSEKVWQPFGMKQNASWLLSDSGIEIAGCCVQATTRDYARFGLFMLGGAEVNGESIVPEGWIAASTTKYADTHYEDLGYGYQWWIIDDDTYAARGIFGQGIVIDTKRNLIIASNGNWPFASDRQGGDQAKKRHQFYRLVQSVIDKES